MPSFKSITVYVKGNIHLHCHLFIYIRQQCPWEQNDTEADRYRQAGWFLQPNCAPSSERPSSECPWASIAARRRAAGSIRISRRASCCCSSAIAGNAIGTDFKMYLFRQFCSNRVEFFFTIHRRHRRKNDGSEFWNSNSVVFENFSKFSKRRRAVPLRPIWLYTMNHKKRSQLSFVCNLVKY